MDVAACSRKRFVEREKDGMHEAKFLTCWSRCAIANAAATCKKCARNGGMSEQRVESDMDRR
jgi:hypothetical protein